MARAPWGVGRLGQIPRTRTPHVGANWGALAHIPTNTAGERGITPAPSRCGTRARPRRLATPPPPSLTDPNLRGEAWLRFGNPATRQAT